MKDTDLYPPAGTGESMTERGEDTAKANKEPGRTDLGTDESGRHAGGSTARMKTSINPKNPVDAESPNIPPG